MGCVYHAFVLCSSVVLLALLTPDPNKQTVIRNMLILMRQYKTCAYFRGKPLFQSDKTTVIR